MPLVNCILCFVKHALLSSLCNLPLKFVVYVPKMPLWVEPTPFLIRGNPKDFMGHTYLVLHQVNFSTTNVIFEKREVNGRLYIEEVGVDLELCVHAHGHDVYPIMEGSCNNNYSLVIISFGICELILCNRGFDHIFSLIPFLGQVKALVFCRSIYLCNLYYDLPSSITPWYLDNITEPSYFL